MTEQPKAARELVKILQEIGDWSKRTAIAERMGKKRLDPGREAMLEMLAAQGVIQSRKVKTNTPVGYRMEYRAK